MSYYISKFGVKFGDFSWAAPSGNPSEYRFLASVTFKRKVLKSERENYGCRCKSKSIHAKIEDFGQSFCIEKVCKGDIT